MLQLSELRAVLRQRCGEVLPKDLRTARASEQLRRLLRAAPVPRDLRDAEQTLRKAIVRVAQKLNHSPEICRQSYFDYQTLLATPLAAYAFSQRLIPTPALLAAPLRDERPASRSRNAGCRFGGD